MTRSEIAREGPDIRTAWVAALMAAAFGCARQPDAPPEDSGSDSSSPPDTEDTGPRTFPVDPDWRKANAVALLGEGEDELTGLGLASGDVDGDGTAELLIGAPTEWQGGVYGIDSAAYLHGAVAKTGPVSGGARAEWDGTGTYTNIGDSVAVLGDVTGVGSTTVILGGLVTSDGIDTLSNPMFVAPFEGSIDVFDPDAWIDESSPAEVAVADRLTRCGDVDGDAQEDLCVPTIPTYTNTGTAGSRIFRGPRVGGIAFDDPDIDLVGPASTEAGRVIAGGGDLDGDGSGDLLVGESEWGGGMGAAHVVTNPVDGTSELADYTTWFGEQVGDEAGAAMALGGDVDGDGAPDAFIGAHLANTRTGRAYLSWEPNAGGDLGTADFIVDGRHEYDWLGAAATMADFDGDEQDDLAVAAPRDIYFGFDRPGRVAVFLGPLVAGRYDEDDADAIWYVSDAPDSFGLRLTSGDLDGDGRAELIGSAPYDSRTAEGAGAVSILYGGGF